MKARLLDLGIVAAFMAGDDLGKFTARDIEAWRQIAQEAKISNE